jgi:hypothetical protein
MLAIRTTDGDLFDLSDNASMDVTGSNPAFDPDVVARFFSFPFQLPATPRNLDALKHANRLDARRSSRDKNVELWFAGSLLKEGRMRVNSNTADRLECVFGNRDRETLERLQEIKIRDLMPQVNMETFSVATFEAPTLPGIGGTITIRLAGDVAGEFVDITGLSLLAGPIHDSGRTIWAFSISPTPTVLAAQVHGFLVEEDYSGQPASIAGPAYVELLLSVLNGQENIKWYLTNLVYDTPNEVLAFPTVYHPNLYGSDNPLFGNYVNWWRDGVYMYNAPSEEKAWATTHVPYVRIKYIFDQIADALGVAWAGELYESDDFAQLCLLSNYTLDNPQEITEASVTKWMNDYITILNTARCVPDWTAADFLKKICEIFAHYVQQEGNTLLLQDKIGQMAFPDYFQYILTEFKVTRVEEKGVTLAFKIDEKDNYDPLENYVIGAGGRRIEVELAPLTDLEIEEDSWTWRMCAYSDKEGRASNGDTPSSATPRIFFDRGEQLDSTGTPYRMSSHLDTDYDDNPIGDLSLEWAGDAGLYENYWRGWAELEDKEPLEMRAVMPVGEVRRMLRWERPRIRFYHPLGETEAIVKEIQFDIRVEDVEQIEARLKMLKL